MVLGFTTKFPDGRETHFQQQIETGLKIHTIRNGKRWKAGMKIHFATGVRTKKYNCFKEGVCISVQDIRIEKKRGDLYFYIDDRFVNGWEVQFVSANDGLHQNDLHEWFGSDLKDREAFEGQIIHWTNHKY